MVLKVLDASGTTFKTLSAAPGAERLITVEVMCDVTGWMLYRYYALSVDVGCPLLQGVVSLLKDPSPICQSYVSG